ncbi:FG-GAP repeat domain-containing protein [Streptomyces sp. NPDC088261]|uniref:FG-GAP repeat domain-containing protein n=1 Tax=Streptomyces sp. NPDC088261 TaxID=3365851 RepID=UPI0038177638
MWDNAGSPAVTDGEVGATAQPTEPEVLPSDTATPEDTPAPSQTGPAATLSLPALDGPSPDSHGALVEAELAGGKWLVTPDADLLTDPSTVYPVFIDPSVKKHVQNWTTVYDRRPGTPTSLDLGPDARCTTTEPYVRIGAGEITFTASGADADRNLEYLDFDLWPTGKWDTVGDLLKSTGKVSVGGDTGSARRTTPGFSTSKLTNNTKYSWRARSFDDTGSSSGYAPSGTPCRFIMDTVAPRPPVVTSTDFPNADAAQNGFGVSPEDSVWSTTPFGTAGSFTFRALNTDVIRYEYGFNSASYPFSVSRANGAATSVTTKISSAKPPTAGPNVLFVRTVDAAGHVSEPNKYLFYASPKTKADTPGDFTGDELPDLFTVAQDGRLFIYPSQATNDLTKGTGDLDYSMPGAYRGNPDKDPNGDTLAAQVPAPTAHFDKALITHNGDIYGGDGLQDLVVRVEGKLWVYPGDGYGAVNIDKRRQILLPPGAPDPASFTQILAAGDATGDGKTDFFATIGDTLWALTGYSGATVEQATQLSAAPWAARELVTAQDITGDGVADLLYRTDVTGRLLLRAGIRRVGGGGGVDLNSLASEANSQGGHDSEYAASGWSSIAVPHILGTPDTNGDAVPDIWALYADGSIRVHLGSRTALSGSGTEVMGASAGWAARQTIG